MRVRFTQAFDYRPIQQQVFSYPAGWMGTVKRECGEKAVAEGKAVELKGREKDDD